MAIIAEEQYYIVCARKTTKGNSYVFYVFAVKLVALILLTLSVMHNTSECSNGPKRYTIHYYVSLYLGIVADCMSK